MSPYISVIFCNRNDGYGGEQPERINAFIRYFAAWDRRHPGLFEFVLCDWNPPADRPSLLDGYDWSALADVRGYVVPAEEHARLGGTEKRPILDYVGRNVAIRRARAPFVLIVNQDIFPSRPVMEELARRRLSDRHFYRADRVDFDFDGAAMLPPGEIEPWARAHPLIRHVRPWEGAPSIHVPIDAASLDTAGSFAMDGERIDPATGIVFGEGLGRLRERERRRLRLVNWSALDGLGPRWDTVADLGKTHDNYWQRYLLHTNASGDFFLAPRAGFEKIHGFIEAADFYMHTDGYACVAMFMAGYDQALFVGDAIAFHADHDRSARAGRPESMNYRDHVRIFCQICRRERGFELNGPDWGLGNVDLPVERGACRTEAHSGAQEEKL